MQSASLLPATFILTMVMLGGQSSPTIPAPAPGPEPNYPRLQIDQPPTVVHGDRRVVINPVQLKQEADELAKLAQSIPPDVDKVSKGQLPQDLATRLKQIEKLSKQLRREVAP